MSKFQGKIFTHPQRLTQTQYWWQYSFLRWISYHEVKSPRLNFFFSFNYLESRVRDKILFSAIHHRQTTSAVCLSQSRDAGKLPKMEDRTVAWKQNKTAATKALCQSNLWVRQRAAAWTGHFIVQTLISICSFRKTLLLPESRPSSPQEPNYAFVQLTAFSRCHYCFLEWPLTFGKATSIFI